MLGFERFGKCEAYHIVSEKGMRVKEMRLEDKKYVYASIPIVTRGRISNMTLA